MYSAWKLILPVYSPSEGVQTVPKALCRSGCIQNWMETAQYQNTQCKMLRQRDSYRPQSSFQTLTLRTWKTESMHSWRYGSSSSDWVTPPPSAGAILQMSCQQKLPKKTVMDYSSSHATVNSARLFSTTHRNTDVIFLWPPYGIGHAIIFSSCGFFFFFFLLFFLA